MAAVEISVTDGSRANISAAYRVLHGLAAGLQTDTHEAWMARMHIEDRPRVTHVIETALAGKAMGYKVEYRVRGASDGAIEWILERINIERDGAGMPLQIVGVGIDITVSKIEKLRSARARSGFARSLMLCRNSSGRMIRRALPIISTSGGPIHRSRLPALLWTRVAGRGTS